MQRVQGLNRINGCGTARNALTMGLLALVISGCGTAPVPSEEDLGVDADVGVDAGPPAGCRGDTPLQLLDGTCVRDDADDDDDGAADSVDCAPLDAAEQVELADGTCVEDDGDDDDDGASDTDDCEPLDPARAVLLADGACVRDDTDDDNDGAADSVDCAPRDSAVSVELTTGACVPNDLDDDDDGVADTTDCAPRDPATAIALTTGACVPPSDDLDGDTSPNAADCAPLDPARQVLLEDGRCVADDDDDDDDGTPDTADCAPHDPTAQVTLLDGRCVADDSDDDDDGTPDTGDCAPLSAAGAIELADGACVRDDADDDDDGFLDAVDCAPLDPTLAIRLVGGACVPDDADDDDDGAPDTTDCAPLDAARQVLIRGNRCVADDDDDDDDQVADATDCTPLDPRYAVGPCDPGEVDSMSCGETEGACVPGTRTRVCRDSCYFGPWGECGGDYVAATTERCDLPGDEDCDGLSNESCACEPTTVGNPTSFSAPGNIGSLQVDPVRCLAYAFAYGEMRDDPNEFVVFDTRTKQEVIRLPYGPEADRFDISQDGERLVIANTDEDRIEIFEPPSWTPVATLDVPSGMTVIAVTTGDMAYFHASGGMYSINLQTGAMTRDVPSIHNHVIELTPDERHLYVGTSARPSSLSRLNIEDDGRLKDTFLRTIHYSIGDLAKPYLDISADGTRAVFGGAVIDLTSRLLPVLGSGDMHLDAFDATGRFVVGGHGVLDTERIRDNGEHFNTSTVNLVSSDQEIWWHESATEQMHVLSIGDVLDPSLLGRREWPPLPLAEYQFIDVLVDPVRPFIYGLDARYGEVVVFDRDTLTPIAAIEAGTLPTEMAIDPAGHYLYVGHYETFGVATIDLEQLTYVGLWTTPMRPDHLVVPRTERVLTVQSRNPPNWSPSDRAPILMNMATGAWPASTATYTDAMLALAGDGSTVYLAESGTSGSCLHVISTAGDQISAVSVAGCRSYPWRGVATIPFSTDVFAGDARRSIVSDYTHYFLSETIHTVTPDGLLAISSTAIYNPATGQRLANLPVSSSALALSPNGRTLYLGLSGSIRAVSLAPWLP